jgi:hypothetical protein
MPRRIAKSLVCQRLGEAAVDSVNSLRQNSSIKKDERHLPSLDLWYHHAASVDLRLLKVKGEAN